MCADICVCVRMYIDRAMDSNQSLLVAKDDVCDNRNNNADILVNNADIDKNNAVDFEVQQPPVDHHANDILKNVKTTTHQNNANKINPGGNHSRPPFAMYGWAADSNLQYW